MKIINYNQISSLNISPKECLEWVREALLLKETSYLPAKYSLHLNNDIFINTMPCFIPDQNYFGVKVVTRYPQNVPSLNSTIFLYDINTGELVALLDGNWITAMRTGAVAATAIQNLENKYTESYGFIGLGNTARATLLCISSSRPNKKFKIKLLNYKDHAELFQKRFKDLNNIEFEVVNKLQTLIENSDVVVSSVTVANHQFGQDSWYGKGILVVPIHTRGFQNCDLFFDKVVVDDIDHIRGFKNFDRFKMLLELDKVLKSETLGRSNSDERILAYNIGIALHDVFFAAKVFSKITETDEINLKYPKQKFWV